MPETRASKQVSVLSRVSSVLLQANNLVIEVSSIIFSDSITLEALHSFADKTRSLYSHVSESLSDLREFCDDENQTRYTSQLLQVQASLASLITTITSRILSSSKQSQDSSVNDQVLETLKQLIQSSRMPLSEPSVFKGDPLEYSSWKNEINAFVDRDSVSAPEKIHCLKKYTSDSARECIDGHLSVFTNESYLAARKVLDTRFGDRFVITFAFREKLEKWPKIANNDCTGLQKFSDFLKQIQSHLTVLNTQDVLDDAKENYVMLKKLPQWIVSKWADRIAEFQERNNDSFPPFADFVTFLSAQAKRCNNPVIVQLSSSSKPFSSTQEHKPSSTSVSNCISLSTLISSTESCLCCGGSHSLQKCYKFAKLSYDNRVAFIREHRLCFGCFTSGHQSRECKNRMKCDVCKRFHSTLLHKSAVQSINESYSTPVVSNVLSSIESNVEMTCSVVPVWLSHASKSSRKKLVYALLDSQSNSSFILDQSLDTFNVSSLDVNLSVSTMTGVHQQVSSRKCSGFKVQGYNSSEVIDLPVVYSRPVIPLDRSHIPRQDTFAHFAHLKETSSKLSYFPDIEIGLLIGFNCSQASIPLKVVLGSNSAQPYAVQTPLGWTIIGSTSNSSSYSSVQDCSLNSQPTVI